MKITVALQLSWLWDTENFVYVWRGGHPHVESQNEYFKIADHAHTPRHSQPVSGANGMSSPLKLNQGRSQGCSGRESIVE